MVVFIHNLVVLGKMTLFGYRVIGDISVFIYGAKKNHWVEERSNFIQMMYKSQEHIQLTST